MPACSLPSSFRAQRPDSSPIIGKRAVVVVSQQKAGRRVAGDVDIRPAIVIEIGRDGGHHITAGGFDNAGSFADVGECAIAVVAVERTAPGRQTAWPAHDRNALPVAIVVGSGFGR